MNEQSWYVYQQGQQLGPFAQQQILQLLDSKMIAQDAYLFKAGWKDWRPIEDTYEELGLERKGAPATVKRRTGAPRASIAGRVVVHNNGQLVIGGGVNISTTGIFVETSDQLFTVGEKLKLTVRCEGLAKPFNVVAHVIRFNTDPRYPVGYGLQFEGLDESIRADVQKLVDRQNEGKRESDRSAAP